MISPRFLGNGTLSIGLETQPPVPTPQTNESYGTSGRKPIRVLSRRIISQPPSAFARSAVGEPSLEKTVTGFGDDQSVRVLASRLMPHGTFLGGSAYPLGNSNRVMASSQFDRAASPSPKTPGGLAGRIAALAGNDSANSYPRGRPPNGTGFENEGLPQPWLFRSLSGRL